MLEEALSAVYTKFKLQYYRRIFSRFEACDATLTAVETFCVEVIHALGMPTVNEFAQYVGISQPNATQKIQNLIKKGFVTKTRSQCDRREYKLSVTERFFYYYNLSNNYVATVVERMRSHFSSDELAVLIKTLEVMNRELMPDAPLQGSAK